MNVEFKMSEEFTPEKKVKYHKLEEILDEEEEAKDAKECAKEEFAERVTYSVESMFGDSYDRSIMDVKKPSKKVMAEALRYGEAQGWGDDWENNDEMYNRMEVALYQVSPAILKKGKAPPKLRDKEQEQEQQAKASFAKLVFWVIALVVLWFWLT